MRWRMQGREDILKYVSVDSSNPDRQRGTFVTDSCPFLQRDERARSYSCTIHDTKPFYCKLYPDDGICEHEENADAWPLQIPEC